MKTDSFVSLNARKGTAMIKLPLKAGESNAIGNAVYVFDGNGTHVATIFGRNTAAFIVSAVNNYEVMQAKLDKAVELLTKAEPLVNRYSANPFLEREISAALKELK